MEKFINKFNERTVCVTLFIVTVTQLLYALLSNYVFGDLSRLLTSSERVISTSMIIIMFSFVLCLVVSCVFEILLIYKIVKKKYMKLEKYAIGFNSVLLILLLCNLKYFNLIFGIFKAEAFNLYTYADYNSIMRFVFNGGLGSNSFLIFTILIDIAFIALAIIGFYRAKTMGHALPNEEVAGEAQEAQPLIHKEDIEAGIEKAKQVSAAVAKKTESTTTNFVSRIKEMSPQAKKKAIGIISLSS